MKEAVLDPEIWLFLILVFCVNALNRAISGFGSVIVRGFGYSQSTSILLTGAGGRGGRSGDSDCSRHSRNIY
jgi:hypothetical protein